MQSRDCSETDQVGRMSHVLCKIWLARSLVTTLFLREQTYMIEEKRPEVKFKRHRPHDG